MLDQVLKVDWTHRYDLLPVPLLSVEANDWQLTLYLQRKTNRLFLRTQHNDARTAEISTISEREFAIVGDARITAGLMPAEVTQACVLDERGRVHVGGVPGAWLAILPFEETAITFLDPDGLEVSRRSFSAVSLDLTIPRRIRRNRRLWFISCCVLAGGTAAALLTNHLSAPSKGKADPHRSIYVPAFDHSMPTRTATYGGR